MFLKKSDLKGHVNLSSISLICTNGTMLELTILTKILVAFFLMYASTLIY